MTWLSLGGKGKTEGSCPHRLVLPETETGREEKAFPKLFSAWRFPAQDGAGNRRERRWRAHMTLPTPTMGPQPQASDF